MGRAERVPVLDLRPEIASMEDDLLAAMADVVRSGRYILGPDVEAFEAEVADYLGCRHAVGVNSGTDALVIGLRALGVGAGGEVITTPFTFVATAEAICAVGAVPVFADIDPATFNIDPAEIERRITPRTRAVIPVHLYGLPAAMDGIMAVARSARVAVVEDAAQAFGASVGGRKVGTVGDVGAFSFFPSKPLGGFGDGGMVVTDDDDLADQARLLRAHGSRRKHQAEVVGYNSRLDELQAALLRVKLRRVEELTEGRRRAARLFTERLSGVPGLVLPSVDEGAVFCLYTVRILDGRRGEVVAALDEAGIDTAVHYPVPLHRLGPYVRPEVSLPESERAAGEVLSLPIWPTIAPDVVDEVATVVEKVLR